VLRQIVQTEAVNRCLKYENGIISALDYRQVPAFIVYRWLPARELCLIVKIDQAEAMAPANEFGRTMVFVALLAIMAAIVVAIGLARTITRPVQELQAGMIRFGRGELPELLRPAKRQDELGMLAREFGNMAISLARKEAELRDQAAKLEETVQVRTADLTRSNADLEQLTQDQSQLIEDLDAFSRSVAHDLKSPLSIILGYSELLISDQDNVPTAAESQHLQTIYKYSRKMNSIIDELLLLAKVRISEVNVEPLPDMGDIVGEAIQRLAFMMEASQTELQLPDSWPVALGYAPWIEQVWVNYLSNALKYGSQPARLKLGATRQPDGMICFWLENQGPEISPEAQGRLFKPFSRVNQVEIEGHGLGLSIVRRIVEKLGGRVGVENLPGYGSRFSFTLPAV
jgi:signal transduction histidine kinase